MDHRDARRRHTLRGALIHVNTQHKHAHGKKQTDAHALEGVKKAKNFPQKLSHIFMASAARCHAQDPCGGGGGRAHRDRRRAERLRVRD